MVTFSPVRVKVWLPAVVLAVIASSCGGGGITRQEVVDRYRRGLVDQGVNEGQARCLTDRFFAGLTDPQLREFQSRDALTDAERQRFAQLADVCANSSSSRRLGSPATLSGERAWSRRPSSSVPARRR